MEDKAMIPSKVSFGLDLTDLPARASQMQSEALHNLSGGCQIVRTNERPSFYKGGTRKQQCEDACSVFGKYCGGARVDGRGNLVCKCG
jgi:hypothetical protein